MVYTIVYTNPQQVFNSTVYLDFDIETILNTTYYKEEEKMQLFVTTLICVVGMATHILRTTSWGPQ